MTNGVEEKFSEDAPTTGTEAKDVRVRVVVVTVAGTVTVATLDVVPPPLQPFLWPKANVGVDQRPPIVTAATTFHERRMIETPVVLSVFRSGPPGPKTLTLPLQITSFHHPVESQLVRLYCNRVFDYRA